MIAATLGEGGGSKAVGISAQAQEACKQLILMLDEDGDMHLDFHEFMHMMRGVAPGTGVHRRAWL